MSNDSTEYSQKVDRAELERIESRLLKDPQNLELMDWVAFMFYSNGVPDKAIEYYRRLAAARPRNASYQYFLGNLHQQQGELEPARECWNQVVSLDLEGEYAARARRKLASVPEES
jgi:tetratricopeptide (TPR) repeat protein